MGKPKPPEPALLFAGFLYNREDNFTQALQRLKQQLSDVAFVSEPMPWEHTEYYRQELGWPIYRRFAFFEKIIDPAEIVDIKLMTNTLEEELSHQGLRTVNIDPGYITLSKVVLATTKNYAHRIYLNRGIYAEVTLYYRKGSYRAHGFTYRDYQSSAYIEIFNNMRAYLLRLLKNGLNPADHLRR